LKAAYPTNMDEAYKSMIAELEEVDDTEQEEGLLDADIFREYTGKQRIIHAFFYFFILIIYNQII
jgi:hypothetical protein